MSHVREVLLWKSSRMMSSVIWIWTLNSITVSGKQQILLHWLHLRWHSKNTRNSSPTASTALLDTCTWQKSKKDTWNRRRNLLVWTRYGAWDFAENYQYLTQDEIQSFHWSKEYCTLHPLVICYKDADGNLQHYSLCLISGDNTHDTSFVHKIQTLLVEFLKYRLPNFTKIYYICDGCGG